MHYYYYFFLLIFVLTLKLLSIYSVDEIKRNQNIVAVEMIDVNDQMFIIILLYITIEVIKYEIYYLNS